MLKKGNTTLEPKKLTKVMNGTNFVWEKAKEQDGMQTVTWSTAKEISQYANALIVPREYQDIIRNKEIISVELLKIGKIKDGIKNNTPFLSFTKSFDEILGITQKIPIDTKIIVTYK